ncbi:MAG: ATP-binding protein [Lachnospiraceae bacterium]|nr:ATP-binding protein [Lachnospiraceae bacterium]
MASYNAKMERLQNIYESKDNGLVLMYGRKGLFKHNALKSFIADKPAVYYEAKECSNEIQREFLAETIAASCDVPIKSTEYKDLFEHLRSYEAKKLVLIISNADYILKKDPDFMENIVKLRNKHLYLGPVMIILVTDSVSFVECELMEEGKKDYKKFDEVLKIEELNFLEVVRMFPDMPETSAYVIYGILGGVPEYLSMWNNKRTVKENVCRLILDTDSPLFHEAENYLNSELREPGVYQTILYAIAQGKEKLNDLYNYTGYSRPKISVYMKNLSKFEAVKKVVSFETGGYENAKKGIYQVSDTFLNFYFRFIFPHASLLHVIESEKFYDAYIAPNLSEFVFRTFVKVCMEFLELSSSVKRLPITIERQGTWVGKRGNIDIIAQDNERNTIACKCCYSEPKFTYEMYEDLLNQIQEAKVNAEYIYLFSTKGFDARLTEIAAQNANIKLIDMNEM